MVTSSDTEGGAASQQGPAKVSRGRHIMVLVVTLVVLIIALASVFFRTAISVIFIPVFLLLVAFCLVGSVLVMRKVLSEA